MPLKRYLLISRCVSHGHALLRGSCAYAQWDTKSTFSNNNYDAIRPHSLDQPVIPALDTLFIGVEDSPGSFQEVCAQCGQCILGETAAICPVTRCHKGLLNGPCGGTNDGKCEVDKEKDCAWTLIYRRLEEQGRLDLTRKYQIDTQFRVLLAGC